MPVDAADVLSREQLVAFIGTMRDEHRTEPEGWKNHDLDRLLAAFGASVDNSPGYWARLMRVRDELRAAENE